MIWLIGLWVLSSLPGEEIELPPFPGADKLAHLLYFAVGGRSACLVYPGGLQLETLERYLDCSACNARNRSRGRVPSTAYG